MHIYLGGVNACRMRRMRYPLLRAASGDAIAASPSSIELAPSQIDLATRPPTEAAPRRGLLNWQWSVRRRGRTLPTCHPMPSLADVRVGSAYDVPIDTEAVGTAAPLTAMVWSMS